MLVTARFFKAQLARRAKPLLDLQGRVLPRCFNGTYWRKLTLKNVFTKL